MNNPTEVLARALYGNNRANARRNANVILRAIEQSAADDDRDQEHDEAPQGTAGES
jgi:hypothetical protein